MAEVEPEARHAWCHKLRIAFFFSAMRHYRDELRDSSITVHYHALTARRFDDRGKDFATVLRKDIRRLRSLKLIAVMPRDYRVLEDLEATARRLDIEMEIRPDRTKPYAASGSYIRRMSNFCGHCRYRYKEAIGDNAWPFTTLYWDFLDRHRRKFARIPRMKIQILNLEQKRKDDDEMTKIRRYARRLREAARDPRRTI